MVVLYLSNIRPSTQAAGVHKNSLFLQKFVKQSRIQTNKGFTVSLTQPISYNFTSNSYHKQYFIDAKISFSPINPITKNVPIDIWTVQNISNNITDNIGITHHLSAEIIDNSTSLPKLAEKAKNLGLIFTCNKNETNSTIFIKTENQTLMYVLKIQPSLFSLNFNFEKYKGTLLQNYLKPILQWMISQIQPYLIYGKPSLYFLFDDFIKQKFTEEEIQIMFNYMRLVLEDQQKFQFNWNDIRVIEQSEKQYYQIRDQQNVNLQDFESMNSDNLDQLTSLFSNKNCPDKCSNRGKCINQKCVCDKGFTGPKCSQIIIEASFKQKDNFLKRVRFMEVQNLLSAEFTENPCYSKDYQDQDQLVKGTGNYTECTNLIYNYFFNCSSTTTVCLQKKNKLKLNLSDALLLDVSPQIAQQGQYFGMNVATISEFEDHVKKYCQTPYYQLTAKYQNLTNQYELTSNDLGKLCQKFVYSINFIKSLGASDSLKLNFNPIKNNANNDESVKWQLNLLSKKISYQVEVEDELKYAIVVVGLIFAALHILLEFDFVNKFFIKTFDFMMKKDYEVKLFKKISKNSPIYKSLNLGEEEAKLYDSIQVLKDSLKKENVKDQNYIREQILQIEEENEKIRILQIEQQNYFNLQKEASQHKYIIFPLQIICQIFVFLMFLEFLYYYSKDIFKIILIQMISFSVQLILIVNIISLFILKREMLVPYQSEKMHAQDQEYVQQKQEINEIQNEDVQNLENLLAFSEIQSQYTDIKGSRYV